MPGDTKKESATPARQAAQDSPKPRGAKAAEKAAEKKALKELKTGAGVDTEGKTDLEKYRDEMMQRFDKLDTNMEMRMNKIERKFDGNFNSLKDELAGLKDEFTQSKTELENTTKKVSEIEKSLTFQTDRLTDSEAQQKNDLKQAKAELDEKIGELNKKLLMMEKQDRKYNLLFYGFPEEKGENLFEKLKSVFVNDMKMDIHTVHRMQFIHGHRLPSESSKGPKPIILRFVSFADRELVLSNAYQLAGSKRRIVSDLPVVMKKERNRLSKEAYKIRHEEKLKTRIKDKGLDIFVQVRKDEDHEWVRRDV
ncbi:MAG: hypothetical protein N0E59_18510 [Candidatus Thiodiazotropha taylori]|nr:hypothetical protein [Candidatus Thiodiazotropha taylori]MCW4285112.1 hypothetical protein [Candidatus Thiodiazotropha taylori]